MVYPQFHVLPLHTYSWHLYCVTFDLFEILSITSNAAVMPWIYTAKPSQA